MRRPVSWTASAGVGFGRSCLVVGASLVVPAVWAAAVAVALWWQNPWTWIAPFTFACLGTFALSRPVARMFRSMAARWAGTLIPAGYREPKPVVQLATGYWWNGRSYERTRKDAEADQRMRLRWSDPATWRDLRFCAIAPFTAGLAAAVPIAALALAVFGLVQSGVLWRLVGVVGVAAAAVSARYAWRAAVPVAVRWLRAPESAVLADRVGELTAQRADITVAQAAELRRIERDLHDGAQARLVSLGLALATAEKLMETDPAAAKALMREARAGAASSLSELRELVQGISPPVLNERGLVAAVRALALDVPLEAEVTAELDVRLEAPIESAVYFGIAELLANAVKHACADRVHITLAMDSPGLAVVVEDDGVGGAAERVDGGLEGLRRRLAVFDGTLEISSPAGGPTRARMVVPCESS